MNLRIFPLTQERADRLLLEQDRLFIQMLRVFIDSFGTVLLHGDDLDFRGELIELTKAILDLVDKPVTTDAGVQLRHDIFEHCLHIIAISGAKPGDAYDVRRDRAEPSSECGFPR